MRAGSWDRPVRPKGYRKPKSRLKVRRSPMYVPVTNETKKEAIKWLKPRKAKK